MPHRVRTVIGSLRIPGTDRYLTTGGTTIPTRCAGSRWPFDRACSAGVMPYVVGKPGSKHGSDAGGIPRGGSSAPLTSTSRRAHSEIAPSLGAHAYLRLRPDVDKRGHLYGVDRSRGGARLPMWTISPPRCLDSGRRALITADHGQPNIPTENRDPTLTHACRPARQVAGEPRCVTCTPPTARVTMSSRPRSRYRRRRCRANRRRGGPVRPGAEDHLQRIGDVVVICTGDYAVMATKSIQQPWPTSSRHGPLRRRCNVPIGRR